jgi:hypothetical protein
MSESGSKRQISELRKSTYTIFNTFLIMKNRKCEVRQGYTFQIKQNTTTTCVLSVVQNRKNVSFKV